MDRGTWWATIYRISESDMTEWQSRHTHLQFSVPHNFASDFYLLSNIQQVFLPPQSISLCLALNFIFPHGTSYILPCTRQTACLLHLRWSEVLVAQSFPTLCDPMDWGLLGSSVHGTLQARTLEQVAISFSRSSWPRDRTHISWLQVDTLPSQPPGKLSEPEKTVKPLKAGAVGIYSSFIT